MYLNIVAIATCFVASIMLSLLINVLFVCFWCVFVVVVVVCCCCCCCCCCLAKVKRVVLIFVNALYKPP